MTQLRVVQAEDQAGPHRATVACTARAPASSAPTSSAGSKPSSKPEGRPGASRRSRSCAAGPTSRDRRGRLRALRRRLRAGDRAVPERIARAVAGPEREVVISTAEGRRARRRRGADAPAPPGDDRAARPSTASPRAVPQARILYEYAAAFARELGHPNIVYRHHELRWCPDPEQPTRFTRHLRVLGAEAPELHGLSPTLMFLDELQAIAHAGHLPGAGDRPAQATRARSSSITSTAASGADTPAGAAAGPRPGPVEVRRRGPVVDARTAGLRWLSWEVPEDADAHDPRVVKQANPASWITAEQLREQRQRLPETAFRRYICNQWTEGRELLAAGRGLAGCVGRARASSDGRADRGRRSTSAASGRDRRRLDQRAICRSASRSSPAIGRVLEIAEVVDELAETLHDRRVHLRPVAGRSDRPGARAARDQGRRPSRSTTRG